MVLTTNQEKATTETKRRIKKKIKKYKKRNRQNASMTPQVARNTRADVSKYRSLIDRQTVLHTYLRAKMTS